MRMAEKEYVTIGGIWKNKYGYNIKAKLPNGEEINWYLSKPHPDYVKDTSPEWFIKVLADATEQEDPLNDEPQSEEDFTLG